jgi:formamidopyrimidine-DNA glycosylase
MQKVIDECRKSCSVEEVLTDQKRVLCGIGNYLKSEILYDAKIAPMRTISNISVSEWKLLFRIMKSKTRKMYTILLRGKEKEFEESMKVYSKKKDPFGNKVETYTDPRGRTTHWVPSVQK